MRLDGSELHPLEREALQAFRGKPVLSQQEILERSGLEEGQIHMAMGWLESRKAVVVDREWVEEWVELTDLGYRLARDGLPELRILGWLQETGAAGLPIAQLRERPDLDPTEISAAIGDLKKAGMVQVNPGGVLVLRPRDQWTPSQEAWLAHLQGLQDFIRRLETQPALSLATLSAEEREWVVRLSRKRGKGKGVFRIREQTFRAWRLTPQGESWLAQLPEAGKEVSLLTPEMLRDGTWQEVTFRRYNLRLPPPRVAIGRRHPYREFLDRVKRRFLAMGFQEMRGPLVETAFWNMDALFMPQFHPARDIHDVYYVREPTHARFPADDREAALLEAVSATHRHGGKTGSRGWRYAFDPRQAARLILRSQGTAVSARTLAARVRIPGKYFSIARCFRYEQVDATHAQDFFQIEGIVLDQTITFQSLLGLLHLFAEEVAGAREIRFLPAYFPFTEPSVELHVCHPHLGWMELGGAGLFRPEVTQPLGIEVPVIAWGLGLDRMAMVALGVQDIRDLFSPDLEQIRSMRVQDPSGP